jgi:hypothetical protein
VPCSGTSSVRTPCASIVAFLFLRGMSSVSCLSGQTYAPKRSIGQLHDLERSVHVPCVIVRPFKVQLSPGLRS